VAGCVILSSILFLTLIEVIKRVGNKKAGPNC
jgi:hypothetical protein